MALEEQEAVIVDRMTEHLVKANSPLGVQELCVSYSCISAEESTDKGQGRLNSTSILLSTKLSFFFLSNNPKIFSNAFMYT